MENQVYHVANITELHKLSGVPGPHNPLITLVAIEDLPDLPKEYPSNFTYGFYSIGLKRNLKGYVKYGRNRYDFDNGLMAFTAPNQLISYENLDSTEATGWLIFFDPLLLAGTPLGMKMKDFGFFEYETNEALHISEHEEAQLQDVFNNIMKEYVLPIDVFSKEIIVANLELLLTYSKRFYKRQFITRMDAGDSLVTRFTKMLNAFFTEVKTKEEGLPGVSRFAEELGVSTRYLSDSLKNLTGKSTKEHIDFKVIAMAKDYLKNSELSVSEIAYQLGFEYPQYFSRLFKAKTGMSPSEFKSK